ncbi:hypothetical protein RND61_27175 [Streptomyces sp. TRM76323]|uniref:Uncharacterized protein n=1 Tax=Streptomyces tamarix TaxID=3078565 RepID=A0ABU3QSH9_9ACTN|nr:hypothetical protein [Streptomyces tamarix]MDT9685720.1 hypothetical protein [Streptomyces tamarix]
MTEPTRYDPRPVEPPVWPEREPAPVAGCARCAGLAASRARARDRGDMSAVTDCNVLLRRHRDAHP